MAIISGRRYTRNELEERVGSIDQLCGAQAGMLIDGKGKGMEIISVKTGGGLYYEILPDRGMGLGAANFNGKSLCWISAVGYVAPWYYDPRGTHWLDSFGGGLLTSCGLTSVGLPCVENNIEYGLHGRLSHIPAEDVSINRCWHNDEYRISVSGRVREYSVFQPELELFRAISSQLGENVITISDSIRNTGYRRSEFMILYHINIGFPFLSEKSKIFIDSKEVISRDKKFEDESQKWQELLPPTEGYEERVFYHRVRPDSSGKACIELRNDENPYCSYGLRISYNTEVLDHFVEWKMMGKGEYVLGIEPGNCFVGGRKAAREANDVVWIEPGEEKKIELLIEVLE